MAEKEKDFDFSDPNKFAHDLMKGLGPLADRLKGVSEQAEKMGIHKQYSFKFKAKNGEIRDGHMVVYKPARTLSINIPGITDEEIKDVLHLLHHKNTDNEEPK